MKRIRTPHYITGLGDGNANNNNKNIHTRSQQQKALINPPKDPTVDENAAAVGGLGNSNMRRRGALGVSGGNTVGAVGAGSSAAMDHNDPRIAAQKHSVFVTDNDKWEIYLDTGDSGDLASSARGVGGVGSAVVTGAGPWQLSAVALLAAVVLLSALFLHIVTDAQKSHNYHYSSHREGGGAHPGAGAGGSASTSRVSPAGKTRRKKKTDEWNDDEEGVEDASSHPALSSEVDEIKSITSTPPALFYPQSAINPVPGLQHYRHRKASNYIQQPTTPSFQHRNYYLNPVIGGAVIHSYMSPTSSARVSRSVAGGSPLLTPLPPREVSFQGNAQQQQQHQQHKSDTNSISKPHQSNQSSPPLVRRQTLSSTAINPQCTLASSFEPTVETDTFPLRQDAVSQGRQQLLPLSSCSTLSSPSPKESPGLPLQSNKNLLIPSSSTRTTRNNFHSFAGSGEPGIDDEKECNNDFDSEEYGSGRTPHLAPKLSFSGLMGTPRVNNTKQIHDMHRQGNDLDGELCLPAKRGKSSSTVDRHIADVAEHEPQFYDDFSGPTSSFDFACPPVREHQQHYQCRDDDLCVRANGHSDTVLAEDEIPFLPSLSAASSTGVTSQLPPPPDFIDLDELNQMMESGIFNISHWEEQIAKESMLLQDQIFPRKISGLPQDEVHSSSENYEYASNDPRRIIKHKRPNLTHSTDSAASLQGAITFSELRLVEVIGGGGFGQVWKAMWRGTPVAVKILTGTAQSKNVPRAVLEEFVAEINLLKGMRHPHICLYMGACLNPPNRAIITELAANGSLWDALRLPLTPPYTACDGISRAGWPMSLYKPDERHGAPPSAVRVQPPIPPKGSWSWDLVKRVACGAARGMAYLHSGAPPVLHRDLKSANILLDESYTAKVCDFGLSRLKAQERSMTGNCGTVQWMAPEVLANMSYNEKADIFSFGIICWELLTRQCPYDGMSAIQCALAVLNRNQRPEIPKWCPPSLHALIRSCMKKNPDERPTFEQLLHALDSMP